MRKFTYLKAILFIFIVSLSITSLIVNVQAASWSKVPSPTKATLESVDMVSSTDGLAVGADGSIIRWDGTSWNNVTSPTTAWLKSVCMVSSTDGWVVGADGIIYHWREAPNFPIEYSIIIGAVGVVVIVWFFLRKRSAHTVKE